MENRSEDRASVSMSLDSEVPTEVLKTVYIASNVGFEALELFASLGIHPNGVSQWAYDNFPEAIRDCGRVRVKCNIRTAASVMQSKPDRSITLYLIVHQYEPGSDKEREAIEEGRQAKEIWVGTRFDFECIGKGETIDALDRENEHQEEANRVLRHYGVNL